MTRMHPLLIFLGFAAFLLQFVSLCHPLWFTIRIAVNTGKGTAIHKTEYGLWKATNDKTSLDLGYFIVLNHAGLGQDWVNAVRAVGILGLLCQAACLTLSVSFACGWKERHYCLYTTTGLIASSAFFFLLLEFSIFADKMSETKDSYEPQQGSELVYESSFVLCIVSWVLTLAAASLFFYVGRCNFNLPRSRRIHREQKIERQQAQQQGYTHHI